MGEFVRFQPWVGEGFCQSRLLILGESHYGESDPDITKTTNTIIRRHLSGEFRQPFFSRLASLLDGKPSHEVDQVECLNRVAFYNYVQRLLPLSRVAPTSEDFRASESAFREILDKLKPDKILAMGRRLYNGTPNVWQDGTKAWVELAPIKRERKIVRVGDFHAGENTFRTGFISHPSGWGFSPLAWHKAVKTFCES